MTVKGFSRKNVSIYFYRFHLYSLCCRSQKLPNPSVSYMNPDVKKKKGKMKQPANMSLYSECRGLAWSQALWEKCDYQTLAEDARKGRMTSVFPSCRISHDISCSEEHFIGSHKPLSPVLSLLQPILLSSHHFTFFTPPSSQVFFQLPPPPQVFVGSQALMRGHYWHGDVWWPLRLLAFNVMNGQWDEGRLLFDPISFPFLEVSVHA